MESIPSDKHKHLQTEEKLIKVNAVVNSIVESDNLLLEENKSQIPTSIDNNVKSVKENQMVLTQRSNATKSKKNLSSSSDPKPYRAVIKSAPKCSSSSDSKPYKVVNSVPKCSSSVRTARKSTPISKDLESKEEDSMLTHDSKKRKKYPDEDEDEVM